DAKVACSRKFRRPARFSADTLISSYFLTWRTSETFRKPSPRPGQGRHVVVALHAQLDAGAGTGLQHDGKSPVIHRKRFPRRGRGRDLVLAVAARLEDYTACVDRTGIHQGKNRPIAFQSLDQGGYVRRQPGTTAFRVEIAQTAVQGQGAVAVVQAT